jgi:alkylresorcinol/alkylpyrone synthase
VADKFLSTTANRLASARIAAPSIAGTGFADGIVADLACTVEMGERALAAALDTARIRPAQVDMMVVVSNTVPAMAGADVTIAARTGFRRDTKRLPLFGLGSVGDAAGVSRLHDYLRGYPGQVAAMLSVDLCSPSMRRDDSSNPGGNEVRPYGNGVASVIVTGADWIPEDAPARPGPRILATRSWFVPDTFDDVSHQWGTNGFRTVVSRDIAEIVDRYLGVEVELFLADYGLSSAAIATWVCHPRDLDIVESVEKSIGLSPVTLTHNRNSTGERGSVSSTSILGVLGRAIAEPPARGSLGVVLAVGPGTSSELLLLGW